MAAFLTAAFFMETRYPNTCIAIQEWRKGLAELVHSSMLRRHVLNRRESRARTNNWVVKESITKGENHVIVF